MYSVDHEGRAVVGFEDVLRDGSENVAGVAKQVAEKDYTAALGLGAVAVGEVAVVVKGAPVLHVMCEQLLVALSVIPQDILDVPRKPRACW